MDLIVYWSMTSGTASSEVPLKLWTSVTPSGIATTCMAILRVAPWSRKGNREPEAEVPTGYRRRTGIYYAVDVGHQ